jgi:MATE family multidrug resistance protein
VKMTNHTTSYPYREILRVGLPLVLGMSAVTLMEFTDRLFLSNYSVEAISAASPAGISAFFFIAFFASVGGYTGVFIAQYYGHGDRKAIGAMLWQGIYWSLAAGFVCFLIGKLAAEPLFALAGHDESVQELEVAYFSVLCQGGVFHIVGQCLAAFFSGRGQTRPVLVITLAGVMLNIPLDYALIFGHFGLPQLGVRGAAIATVSGWAFSALLLAALIFRGEYRGFGLWRDWRFQLKPFLRLLRYGVPGSLQMTFDICAFTLFLLLVGRLGVSALAATNIAFTINSLAFMPAMGASQAVSILVGQELGRDRPDRAAKAVWGSIHLLLIFTFCLDLAFLFFPETILGLFIAPENDPKTAGELLANGKMLLRIIAIYLMMDALYMAFSGALRGAGDTRFLMICAGFCYFCCLVAPAWIAVVWWPKTLFSACLWLVVLVAALFACAAWRYRQGRWRRMLIIETNKERP